MGFQLSNRTYNIAIRGEGSSWAGNGYVLEKSGEKDAWRCSKRGNVGKSLLEVNSC